MGLTSLQVHAPDVGNAICVRIFMADIFAESASLGVNCLRPNTIRLRRESLGEVESLHWEKRDLKITGPICFLQKLNFLTYPCLTLNIYVFFIIIELGNAQGI